MNKNPIAIIGRSVGAGTAAGFVAALFFLTVSRPTLDEAIAFEDQLVSSEEVLSNANSDSPPSFEPSRQTQAIGAVVATVLYGSLLGVVFGTVFVSVRHLLPATTDFMRSNLLAMLGFVTTVLLPAIKYPANPPGVGNPDDVNQRTVVFFTLIGAGVASAVGVLATYRWLCTRTAPTTAKVIGAVVAIAFFVGLVLLWPPNTTVVPAGYPEDLLLRFRLQSLTTLMISWVGIGILTGFLLRRHTPPKTA